MPDPAPIAAHANDIDLVVKIIIGIAGFLAIWVLAKMDRNQSELFRRLLNLEKGFYQLLGEHKARRSSDKQECHPD